MARGDLQRLASGFVTLWIWIFAPSFLGWGIVVRFFGGGTNGFHRVWHWLEDKPTYPVLVSPLSSVAWDWLENGGAVVAFVGFTVLVALWSAILALPPLVITVWWRLAAGRLGGSASPPPRPPTSVRSSSSSSPSPLYLLTLPPALAWAGLRKVGGWAGSSPTVWVSLALFVVTGALVTGFFAFIFGLSPYWERYDILDTVSNTLWYGYLDTIHVPHVFQGRWSSAMQTIYDTTENTRLDDWPDYMGAWYRHAEFRTVVWTTAVRHGLAVVAAYLSVRLARRIVKGVW